MKSRNTPSDEEFARASAALRCRARGLSEARTRLLERFKEKGLREIFIMDRAEYKFHAFVFYETNAQIQEAAASGLSREITLALHDELEAVGRGSCDENQVAVEFDSQENVEANYEGDYYLRLR